MSVHYNKTKIEIQNCISFAFFFSTLIEHFQASRPQRSNRVSPFVPDVDVDQPEPQPNVAGNAEAPILPVDGNNGQQPIASPQPSDDGDTANVAVNHEQRRHLRPLAQVFFFFIPFITLFSPSSDIQGVGEGHPPACLTNYKYGILMVPWYACSHLSFIYHAF